MQYTTGWVRSKSCHSEEDSWGPRHFPNGKKGATWTCFFCQGHSFWPQSMSIPSNHNLTESVFLLLCTCSQFTVPLLKHLSRISSEQFSVWTGAQFCWALHMHKRTFHLLLCWRGCDSLLLVHNLCCWDRLSFWRSGESQLVWRILYLLYS